MTLGAREESSSTTAKSGTTRSAVHVLVRCIGHALLWRSQSTLSIQNKFYIHDFRYFWYVSHFISFYLMFNWIAIYYTMLYYTILCTILYDDTQCDAMSCYAMLLFVIPYYALGHRAMLCYTTRHYIMLNYTMLHHTILYYTLSNHFEHCEMHTQYLSFQRCWLDGKYYRFKRYDWDWLIAILFRVLLLMYWYLLFVRIFPPICIFLHLLLTRFSYYLELMIDCNV